MLEVICRPLIVTDAHLDYLDELRESGETNMWGACRYLRDEFGISEADAGVIFDFWKDFWIEEKWLSLGILVC